MALRKSIRKKMKLRLACIAPFSELIAAIGGERDKPKVRVLLEDV